MAFKSKITPNIGTSVSPSTITPTISVGQTATLIGLSIANIISSNITASAKLNKNGGSSSFLIKDAIILPGGTLIVVGSDQKVVIEEGDTITSYASTSNSADVVISYLI